jgi:biopolymer transport protein TolR
MPAVQRRKGRRQMSAINVVPYIDVMLVLLVIFMITAPLLKEGVEIDLPEAQAEPLRDASSRALIVSVDADGQYFLRIGDGPDRPVAPEALVERVTAQLQSKPNTPVLVRGDGAVVYRKVMGALVMLQGAGVDKVGLMTEPPEEDG